MAVLFGYAAQAQLVTPADEECADAPSPSGWGFYGNSSDGSAMDGEGATWLGTSDETEIPAPKELSILALQFQVIFLMSKVAVIRTGHLDLK